MMQKRMRHSDPKLTMNVYTHFTLMDEAAEIAKISCFFPMAGPKTDEARATGTDGSQQSWPGKTVESMGTKIDTSKKTSLPMIPTTALSIEPVNKGPMTVGAEKKLPVILGTKTDTNGPDLGRKIRTYVNNENLQKGGFRENSFSEPSKKLLDRHGVIEDTDLGNCLGSQLSAVVAQRFRKAETESHNSINTTSYNEQETPATQKLTLPPSDCQKDMVNAVREMANNLAEIVAAWPTLPEAIRAGIVAMVKATAKHS
jgi:hypothetical protein